MTYGFVFPLATAIALIGLRAQRPAGPGHGFTAAVFALGALSGALAVLN